MPFESEFHRLTGYHPMNWQTRIFRDQFAEGELPAALDIPTGLGKTSVMAIWYIALKSGAKLPRRLVYVVDRRAVVDQATMIAESIKARSNDDDLHISTLRGEHADNRKWLEDPGKPTIIVGTVDMIGSRLLFSGYGVTKKSRAYHAGLLGVDALVILDESHLVPPFERLLEAVEVNTSAYGPRTDSDRKIVPDFRLLSLSATAQARDVETFMLNERVGDLDDKVVKQRLYAAKHIHVEPCGDAKLKDALALHAWKLSGNGEKAARVLVYCNSRETASKTEQAITKLAKEAKIHIKSELFVGARRVRERIGAADRLQQIGFLASTNIKLDQPAFVISTAAGEVGVDMDADHMVCDLVAWERMVQRFGRVNRKGEASAQVVLVTESPSPSKVEIKAQDKRNKGEELSKVEQKAIGKYDERCAVLNARLAPFDNLTVEETGIDINPGAIRALKLRSELDDTLRHVLRSACTPPPLYPALNRALVDAWSMTSLDKHTGRPQIGPWLRGWVTDDPQTEVIWRRHLPIRVEGAAATKNEIEAFFEAAPPHLSERLATESWRVCAWLRDRAITLMKQDQALAGSIVAFAMNPDGSLRKSLTLRALVPLSDKKKEKLRKEELEQECLTGATLIVDWRMGGLSCSGLLDNAIGADHLRTADDGGDWHADVGFRVITSDAMDADHPSAPVSSTFATQLSDEGDDLTCLLIETTKTENSRAASSQPQLLSEHQSWAEDRARKIGAAVNLNGEYADALTVAARLHDEGKRASRWQIAFNAPVGTEPYAKTRGPLVMARLGGYRHEFGSLHYAELDPAFQRLSDELQDLVLHLIAAHHGRARPVIGIDGCDAPPSTLQTRARDVALRYARLQKQWGPWGLAWWEALLRAADQQASRDNDNRGINDG